MTELKAFCSHAEIMEYLLVKIEGKYMNKIIHASGTVVRYDQQGSLREVGSNILGYYFSTPSNWSPYIEPNKPAWYEVARPREVLFWAWDDEVNLLKSQPSVFKFYDKDSSYPFITVSGATWKRGEPLTPEEVHKYLNAAIRIADATK